MWSLRTTIFAFVAILGTAVSLLGHATAQEKSIVVASTTSATDSGLFGHLLPIFTRMTGITVNVVAVGTGLALDVGRRGEADVVIAHAKIAELP
jgi:tungstate transport system substrate-binding protein